MSFSKLFSEIWRDYVTDGVPASGAHAPIKADIRSWGLEVESVVTASAMTLAEMSEPATPASGFTILYADTNGLPVIKRDDGSVLPLLFLEPSDL
jgi:hypothetical protein